MPSTFPNTPDDLGRTDLTHGDVTDALAAVEAAVSGILAAPSGRLLNGQGAPPQASVDALDGINDPWQWSPYAGAWIRGYHVTWQAGAVFDVDQLPDDPRTLHNDAHFSSNLPFNLTLARPDASDPVVAPDYYLNAYLGWRAEVGNPETGLHAMSASMDGPIVPGGATGDTVSITFADPGSGIFVITSYESNFTHTAPVAPDLDVTPVLASGFTVGAPYVFAVGTSAGNDGDTWRDTAVSSGTIKLYGPKVNGFWPVSPVIVNSSDLTSPNGTRYGLTVSDDGTLGTEPL